MSPHWCHPTPSTPPVPPQQCHPTAVTPRVSPKGFSREWALGPFGDTREATIPSVTLSWCHPVCGVPQPSRGHVPAPSPPQPSPELRGRLGGGTVTVTSTVTHGTPGWPGLLHGDIVPPRVSPAGRGGRPGGAAGTESGTVPAAEPGAPAGHTAPRERVTPRGHMTRS